MASTTGPLFSFDASGKIGDSIVFSRWRGRPYVRRLVTPSNPRSAAQTGVRAMMRFLSQQWAGLTATEKATWAALADATNILNFNAYTQQNQKRWASFKAPGKNYPVPETGTQPTITTITATGGVGEVQITASGITPNDGWGLMIFRSQTTGFATSRNTAVRVIPLDGTNDISFTDTGLTAGTYFYNFRSFTNDGALSAELGEQSATVT